MRKTPEPPVLASIEVPDAKARLRLASALECSALWVSSYRRNRRPCRIPYPPGCDRTVGPIHIVGSILVDSAKKSVVCPQTLARNGVAGIFQKLDSPTGMGLVYPTHTVECVLDGTLGYRLPVSGTSIKEYQREAVGSGNCRNGLCYM